MKIRMPVPNTLLRVGLLLMIIKVLLSALCFVEMPELADTFLSIAASMFLVGSILQKRYPLGILIVFACAVVLGLITSIRTGNLMIYIAIITCLAVCRENLERVTYFLMSWETFFIMMVMLLSFVLHLFGIPMLTRMSGKMVYNFGFSHPNVCACFVANLFAMYLWLHYEDAKIKQLLTIFALEMLVGFVTDSRTGLIVSTFLMVSVLLFRGKQHSGKVIRFGAKYALPFLTVVFYALCKAYVSGNSLVLLLDKLVSGRIWLGAYSINRFGVSLLGINLTNVVVKWDEFWRLSGITFDNVYTYLLVTQFVWLLVVSFLFYKIANRGTVKHCIFILSWALYGVAEIHALNPYMFFVILLVTCLSDRKFGRTDQ